MRIKETSNTLHGIVDIDVGVDQDSEQIAQGNAHLAKFHQDLAAFLSLYLHPPLPFQNPTAKRPRLRIRHGSILISGKYSFPSSPLGRSIWQLDAMHATIITRLG